jgi:hypothetical protein
LITSTSAGEHTRHSLPGSLNLIPIIVVTSIGCPAQLRASCSWSANRWKRGSKTSPIMGLISPNSPFVSVEMFPLRSAANFAIPLWNLSKTEPAPTRGSIKQFNCLTKDTCRLCNRSENSFGGGSSLPVRIRISWAINCIRSGWSLALKVLAGVILLSVSLYLPYVRLS